MLISIQPRRDIPFRASSLSNSPLPTLLPLPSSLPLLSTFCPHPHFWRALCSSRVHSPSFSGTKLNLAGGNSSLSTIPSLWNGRTDVRWHRKRDRYRKNLCNAVVHKIKKKSDWRIRFQNYNVKHTLKLRKFLNCNFIITLSRV